MKILWSIDQWPQNLTKLLPDCSDAFFCTLGYKLSPITYNRSIKNIKIKLWKSSETVFFDRHIRDFKFCKIV